MAEITTYFSQSAQREIPFAEMSYSQLVNTINKVARSLGGGTSPLLEALRRNLASRPTPTETGQAAGAPASTARATAREPAADPRGLAKIGDNNPPAEPTVADRLRERLEADYATLVSDIAEHELKAAKLPKEVNSDDDVALINAWVVRARELWTLAEVKRKSEKEDYLQAGKAIDAFFSEIKADVTARALTIEQRSTPYLTAKKVAADAVLRAQAEAKRKAAEEAAEAEQAALRNQAAARRQAEEAEAALRNAATEETRKAAEASLRDAERTAQTEGRAAEQAGKDVRQAVKSATRDEKIADGGHRHKLGKVAAGGGSASLKVVWKHRVTDLEAVVKSLGPLAPFIGSDVITSALMRAAKADPRPEVPGAEFFPETQTQTR